MKILLVQPFGSGSPPLGLCLISAELKAAGYKDISFVDLVRGDFRAYIQSPYRTEEHLVEKLKERPDVLLLTASVATFKEAHEVIRMARPYAKTIILGGPHATLFQQRVLELVPELDIVVYGEADATIAELIRRLENGEDLSGINGVIYRSYGQIIKNPMSMPITDLDKIPFPDRDMLDIRTYNGAFCMLTSRGCPYSCTFCSRPVTGKLFRGRSAKNVVDEMEFLLKKYPEAAARVNRTFTIVDENFGVDRQRMIDVAEEIIRRNLGIKFILPNGLHVASADLEVFRKLKQAGCQLIYFGMESGNDETLKRIRKASSRQMIKRAIDLCHETGIKAGGHFIIGLEDETPETAMQTIRFIKESGVDYANLNHAVPEPGTPLWEYVRSHGKFLLDFTDVLDYSRFYMDNVRPQFETPEFTAEQRISVYNEGLKVIDDLLRSKVLSWNNMAKFVKETRSLDDYIWAMRRAFTMLVKKDLRRQYQPKPSVVKRAKEKVPVETYM